MLSDLTAKVSANDSDWLQVKAVADSALALSMPIVTITGATNASPVAFTVSESLAFGNGAYLVIAGGTGSWAGVNGAFYVTVTGTHTFTIAVNSSAFGSFSGQTLTVMVYYGAASGRLQYGDNGAYQGDQWLLNMQALALTYQVCTAVGTCSGGAAQYATKALQWLDYANSLGAAGITQPVSADTGWSSRTVPVALALVYDWCYDQLSSGQKTATAVTAHTWLAWTSANAFGRGADEGSEPNSNYVGGHILGYGPLGYTLYGDDANAQDIIDFATGLWTNVIGPGFSAPVVGNQFAYTSPRGIGIFYSGVPTEYNYNSGHFMRLMQYMLAIKTATGSELSNAVNYRKLWANAILYDLKPDRWRTRMDGNYSGNVTGVFTGGLPLYLSYTLSGTTEGEWMQWMFTHFGTPTETTFAPNMLAGVAGGYADRLLFYRPSATATDYRLSQPTYRFAAGSDFRMYWRSDWTDSAVWWEFHGSAEQNGMSYNAGDMELVRGTDHLIVNSQNWRGATTDGVSGTPTIYTSGLKSGYSSTLFCDALGAYYPCVHTSEPPASGDNAYGGNAAWGKYTAPLHYLMNSNVGYVSADITTAYDHDFNAATRALRYWYREVLAMGGGTQIVWDRVKMLDASYIKHFRWHLSAAGTPSKTGNVVTTVVGSSAIFIDPVLPTSPTVKIVRNLNENSQSVNWRVEINDSVTGTDLNALTVLYATASNGSLPTTVAITTDANHVGVQVADTTPKVAVFAAPVTDNGNNTYTPTTYISATFASTHSGTGKYLIAGLAPGTYSVLRGGAAVPGYASVPVGTDGTLFFNATAGAFSVLQSTSTISPCDLNGDGTVNIVDVQIAINQVAGLTPCGSADLDRNGLCNIVDLQRLINAALGQTCKVGQ
jgi:hypothetical protein